MKVSCQSCGASYAIADDKVSGRLVKVRCKSCHNAIVVDGRQPQPEAQVSPARASSPPAAPAEAPAAPVASSQEQWSVNLSETDSRTMTLPEIMAAYERGELAEAYVWKDGMTDWKPLLEVPELESLLSKPGGPSQPPAFDFGVQPHTSPGSTAYSLPEPEVAKPAAARLASTRGPAQDLFGGVERAGNEEEARSAPAEVSAPHKLTGARNENSVLFSLDALKAGLMGQPGGGGTPASAAAKPAAPKAAGAGKPPPRAPGPAGSAGARAPERQLDDVMNIGGGNPLFSFSADQALLTAPAPPEPKPEPKPRPIEAAGIAPAMYVDAPRRKNTMVLVIAAAFGLLGVTGAIAAVVITQSPKPAAPTDSSALALSVPSTPPRKSAEPTASAAPAESVAESKLDAGAPSTAPAAAQRTLTPEEQKKYAEAKRKADEERAKKAEEEREKKEKETKVAASGFDKNAAVSALTSASSAASACKRTDGPTGTGKVSVTFAPSGRATNAVISGGAFAGTSVGGCVASVFRRARVPAFSGDPVTVSKSFTISP